MNDQPTRGPEDSVDEEFEAARFNTAVAHCFDKIDSLVIRLQRYPLEAIAVAMGTYLQDVFAELLEEGACTADDLRRFLHDIESGAVEADGSRPGGKTEPGAPAADPPLQPPSE